MEWKLLLHTNKAEIELRIQTKLWGNFCFLDLLSRLSSWRIVEQINFCPFNAFLFSNALLRMYMFSCTDLFFMLFSFFGYFSLSPPSHLFSCFQVLFLSLCKQKCKSFRFFLWDDCYCGPLHILLQIPKNRSLKTKNFISHSACDHKSGYLCCADFRSRWMPILPSNYIIKKISSTSKRQISVLYTFYRWPVPD